MEKHYYLTFPAAFANTTFDSIALSDLSGTCKQSLNNWFID